METQKPLLKDEDGEEVDVHMYRSMIGSLMYLTSSRPDIMFAVCACARYQVNPKVSHLHVVKRIFRYLKGQPKLGLWYLKDSPFDLVAYTDSDYARASLDRKYTTGGCQFLGSRLISWQWFEQIVDFLNAHTIKYALTVNPTIYTSCIEQFWATVKAKTINGEVQLQALVDGKKIIITESIVRRDLQLEDAEGVDCLPNATIFKQLTLMGYEKLSQKLTFYKAFFSQQWKFLIHTILQCLSAKTTAWNEFSSTIASAIICLATNQKFNFSKYIFESMVKKLEIVSGKFLIYPRFVQVFVNQQLKGMPVHKRIYIAPSYTKKIFGNMRRVGKGFSGRDTPLFQTMVVQDQEKIDEAINEEMDDSLVRAATTASSLEAEQDSETMGDTIAQTRFKNVSKHSNDLLLARVLALETTRPKAEEIVSLKKRVKKLERKKKSRTQGLKRLYKVGSSRRVESSDEEGLGEEDASKQGKIYDIDDDVEITLVSTHFDADTDMFGVHDLDGDELVAAITRTIHFITDDEITLAKALAELKSAKPPTQAASTRPKYIAEEEEEKGLLREKLNKIKKSTLFGLILGLKLKLIMLAQRLQFLEQEELTNEKEKTRVFVQFLEQEEKFLPAKESRREGTDHQQEAQSRSIMCNYLKTGGMDSQNLKKQEQSGGRESQEGGSKDST
ncbi:hypothetical protein Tco_0527484 [Tanacetum coccineum]